jgi:hypothetical protein
MESRPDSPESMTCATGTGIDVAAGSDDSGAC